MNLFQMWLIAIFYSNYSHIFIDSTKNTYQRKHINFVESEKYLKIKVVAIISLLSFWSFVSYNFPKSYIHGFSFKGEKYILSCFFLKILNSGLYDT